MYLTYILLSLCVVAFIISILQAKRLRRYCEQIQNPDFDAVYQTDVVQKIDIVLDRLIALVALIILLLCFCNFSYHD